MKLRDKCEADVALDSCPYRRREAAALGLFTHSFLCPRLVHAVRNYRRRVRRRARKAAPV